MAEKMDVESSVCWNPGGKWYYPGEGCEGGKQGKSKEQCYLKKRKGCSEGDKEELGIATHPTRNQVNRACILEVEEEGESTVSNTEEVKWNRNLGVHWIWPLGAKGWLYSCSMGRNEGSILFWVGYGKRQEFIFMLSIFVYNLRALQRKVH
jgi:hypothetical protein